MQIANSTFRLLSKIAAFVCALLLCSCSPTPSDTSHSVVFAVSLDDGPAVTGGFSWVCRYSQGFSERDMAKYVEAKSVPADAAVNYVKFADGRMAMLRPSQWPQLSAEGLCTVPEVYGWEGFLVEAETPVATLTWFREGSTEAGKPRISISNVRAGTQIPTDRAENAVKVKRLLSESSKIVAYYFELPLLDGIKSSQLSPQVVSALRALPKDRPTLLTTANPTNSARKPRQVEGPSQFIELPNFQLADSDPEGTLTLQLKKLGEPIRVPGAVFSTETPSVSMSGLKAPPQVLFPQIKEAVALVPLAAVWYPSAKRLIVVNWEDNSDEVQARLM